MVTIRLSKTGKKGEGKYRVVVKEKRSKRDGSAIEILGWFEKKESGEKKKINEDRLKYWLNRGAICTPTVKKLIE